MSRGCRNQDSQRNGGHRIDPPVPGLICYPFSKLDE